MNIYSVITVIILAGIYYLSSKGNKAIQSLDKTKATDQAAIDALKAQDLKAQATAEQSNATEEQKQDFWKKDLK